MQAFVLGGSGQYGRVAAEYLAQSDDVDSVVIAGRSLEHARATAEAIGPKASAVAVDATDADALAARLGGADVLVNMSGLYVTIGTAPLRAAIRAGVPYCDIAEHWSFFEDALTLDAEAKAAGVAAVVGAGANPGTSNLLASHAAARFDAVDEIQVRWVADDELTADEVRAVADDLEESDRVPAGFEYMILGVSRPSRNFENGRFVDVAPFATTVPFEVASGETVTLFPIGLGEPVTLARTIPGVKTVTNFGGFYPQGLNELLRRQADRVVAGEVDTRRATIEFFRACADEPERWIARGSDRPQGTAFVAAVGTTDGRRGRYQATLNANYEAHDDPESASTSSVAALAALKLARGEVAASGVMACESAFEPLPFFRDLAAYWAPWDEADGLLIDSYAPTE